MTHEPTLTWTADADGWRTLTVMCGHSVRVAPEMIDYEKRVEHIAFKCLARELQYFRDKAA